MKTIIYAASAVPEELYRARLPENERSDVQSQKFNRSVIAGLRENGHPVLVFSYRTGMDLPQEPYPDPSSGAVYRFPAPGGRLSVFRQCYRFVRQALLEHPDAVVMADVLNITVSFAAALAARRLHRHAYGIVTDIPGIDQSDSRIRDGINRFAISRFSGYVFLTEPMNGLLNPHGKPYAVMEGLYTPVPLPEPTPAAGRTVLYAGSLQAQFGVKVLLEAFRLLPDPDLILALYGSGNYTGEIEEAAKSDPRIRYFGVRDNATVLSAERSATLLVNPRSPEERFTRYSFPSKTIEYMSTGTPVLMQPLPGMPEEYHHYLYLYTGDEPSTLAGAISGVLAVPESERAEKGRAARDFLLKYKQSGSQMTSVFAQLNKNSETPL